MEDYKRHLIVWKLLRRPLTAIAGLKVKLKNQMAPTIDGPYIVVANHNTDLDPILVSKSFKKHMYFLGSEHILSWGWKSKLILWLGGSITKLKSTPDAGAVKDVLRRLRKGHRVLLFPEGNRSYNGLTRPIVPATGKLIKAAKVPLVTYRFEGGYFTSPRWARSMRRGGMKGYVVNVYTFEDLEKLTDQEINQLIQNDLHEDAYARQSERPTKYKGKNLAEWLEVSLYMCPVCKSIGSLKSKGNSFFCSSCDMYSTIDEYGYFHSDFLPFDTVTKWDIWQREEILKLAQDLGHEEAFFDMEQKLYLSDPISHERRLITKGRLTMYKDRITIADYEFKFNDIIDFNINGRMTLIFSVGNNHYEIKADFPTSSRKYVALYRALGKNKDIARS